MTHVGQYVTYCCTDFHQNCHRSRFCHCRQMRGEHRDLGDTGTPLSGDTLKDDTENSLTVIIHELLTFYES